MVGSLVRRPVCHGGPVKVDHPYASPPHIYVAITYSEPPAVLGSGVPPAGVADV